MLILIAAYIVGSIPTGYWFSKYIFGIDITQRGSGNIGATNVARVLGKRYFLLIFSLDSLKAFLFLISIKPANLQYLFMVSFALLVGNAYSIFLNFRGGKGVATTIGILFAVAPYKFALVFLISWLLVLTVTKRSDVASLSAIFITLLIACFLDQNFVLFMTMISCWILFRHKNNFWR